MPAAIALLQNLQTYLGAQSNLASATIDVALPESNADLPLISLWLTDLEIPSIGLGQHTQVTNGALQVQTIIDLANPSLPGDTEFSFISSDRNAAILLHGGLVDSEGSSTPLTNTDMQVDIDGNPLTLAETPLSAGQFNILAESGQLTFGSSLPNTGMLTATYYIGQWQRIVEQLSGTLHASVTTANTTQTRAISDAMVESIAIAHQNIGGLRALNISQLDTIENLALGTTNTRQRNISWLFSFEHIINQPESSGGIIQSIILRTRRDSFPFEEEDIT